MGRKRWWRGALELLFLSFCFFPRDILADGYIGCLFSKNVCNSRTETCFNDLAFGKCIPLHIELNDYRLYQYSLDPGQLERLRLQLEKLEIEGYSWPHSYTQCVMRISLSHIRDGLYDDPEDLCKHLKGQFDHRYRMQNDIKELNNVPPLAIVKFTPSNINPHGDFADEFYYPPSFPNDYARFSAPQPDELFYSPYADEGRQQFDYPIYRPKITDLSPYDEYDPLMEENFYQPDRKIRKKSLTLDEMDEQLYQPLHYDFPNLAWTKPYRKSGIDSLKDFLEEDQLSRGEDLQGLRRLTSLPDDNLEFITNVQDNPEDPSSPFDKQDGGIYADDEYERTFSRKYKYPKRFSDPEFEDDEKQVRNKDFEEDVDYPIDNDNLTKDKVPRSQLDDDAEENGIYTEGGLLESFKDVARNSNSQVDDTGENDDDPYSVIFSDDLDSLLRRRELAGFKRPERLDVKKPGPSFATNNFAFKTQSPSALDASDEEYDETSDVQFALPVKKELSRTAEKPNTSVKNYKNVDLDHVYIEFKQEFHTWLEGELVVQEVARLLDLSSGILREVRVGRAEVTFKVTKNSKDMNATDVVNSIDNIRGKLRENTGFEVIRAGIGDKAKLPATLEVDKEPETTSSLFSAIVAAGIAAAVAAAAVTLVIARWHAKSRAKLAGLATPDPEASKDYQELCRVRMQAKQPAEKPESPRVTSLSRESEANNSPSNRSSTSSWGEEPTLTNMDISTGHMVLSYMEDHLKNKDRLEEEWAAICAYEAEPSSIDVAKNEANDKYNRPGAALPYDHSRIVLNDLTNANNSDYINASTITDHDPRNPAYIASQGPLPQTAADFWQMVWEQGSVVIVMLTRLTEEGRGMCHRYWPDEGSELYHIYEVHLVSEHFWCDDYLVRSFYLKNLRTGETRTVTQFHFMSWPENGVPHSTKALLEFRRKVNKSYRGRSCPIVVHCSDGAGRTGTYCLIDMVLNRMAKGAKEIDIAATLEHIRDQRPHMVATKQQFEFVLMAVAEEVHAILKALPVPAVEKTSAPPSSSPGKTDQ